MAGKSTDGDVYGANEVPLEYERDDDVREHRSLKDRLVQVLAEDRLALFGLVVIVIFALTAILANYVTPLDPFTTYDSMQPPGSYSQGDFNRNGNTVEVFHVLGTDSYGHDLLSRIIYGARISLLVALATVCFAFTAGTAIGLIAGYYGGWVDNLLMRYIDFQWAFPAIILAAGIIAFAGRLGALNVIIAVGVAFIDDFARLVRGEVLSIREEEYISAAKAVGMGDIQILTREVLPNAVAPLIVQVTILIPLSILAEASLSFLGLGVRATTPTWGLLISDGRQFIGDAWWISVMPGLAIMITVLAFNLFGDGLQDAFNVDLEET